MGIHWTGIVFGLGAIISFGYWTTDFLVVQRVLSAKDLRAAKMAPVIGAAFKMFVPFIVILPGLIGIAVLPMKLVGEGAAVASGSHSYNEVLPLLLARYCGPGLLGLGVTALMAGFMSGMAGNVSAFSTVWTYDIYSALFHKNANDQQLVRMGRWSTTERTGDALRGNIGDVGFRVKVPAGPIGAAAIGSHRQSAIRTVRLAHHRRRENWPGVVHFDAIWTAWALRSGVKSIRSSIEYRTPAAWLETAA